MNNRYVFYGFFLLIGFGLIQPAVSAESDYQVYRGISHLHTRFSHDATGRLSTVIEEGAKLGFDFMIVTDHNSMEGKKFYARMEAPSKPKLFFGNEISTEAGHVIAMKVPEEPPQGLTSDEIIDWIHEKGGYAILAHTFGPKDPWENKENPHWDGFEIYNYFEAVYRDNPIGYFIDSYGSTADDLLRPVQVIQPEHYRFWDETLKTRRIFAMGGTDAHLKDRIKHFAIAIQSVSVYVLSKNLEENEIFDAIGSGRFFIAFDNHVRADGFSFWGESGGKTFQSGEALPLGEDSVLHVRLPQEVRIRVVGGGETKLDQIARQIQLPLDTPGAYRVEVYRGKQIWIISNPIYVEA